MSSEIRIESLKEVMGRFATGIAIVTALEESRPVGFTCQSFVSLSLDPPLIALAPAKTSTSWPRIRAVGVFCVNLISETQKDLCGAFARSGGDKFAGIKWSVGPNGAPMLPDSLAWIVCTLELAHDAGDHEIVIGRVVKVIPGAGRPLVFYRSGYARLEA
jgi:3-hydroxy-9,10-secoandrosta-1,3,5(10)-triene-9,17-dione monooxygenase reductase component